MSYSLAKTNVNFRTVPELNATIQRWCLDFPEDGRNVTAMELGEEGLTIHGWLLLHSVEQMQTVEIYVQQGESLEFFPLTHDRPDVIKAFQVDAGFCRCGFKQQVKISHEEFTVGIRLGHQRIALSRYQVRGPFAILHGTDGWLFLDNDTNKSVAQHTGELLLDEYQQSAWLDYMQGFSQFAKRNSTPYALLVAPAKEAVYRQFHPYPRSDVTVVEQLQTLAPDKFPLVYPEALLAAAKKRPTFRMKDTHWTHYGAMLATLAVCQQLGVDSTAVKKLFAGDRYSEREVDGDLGNKVYPPEKHSEAFLKGNRYLKRVVYDNGLENFGRTQVFWHQKALVSGHCLVFGSSSAYSMLAYLTRVFSQVTLIHTAGNIDPALVQALQPDFLLAQTNGRFVVVPPTVDYDLRATIAHKLAAKAPSQRDELIAAAAAQTRGLPEQSPASVHNAVELLFASLSR